MSFINRKYRLFALFMVLAVMMTALAGCEGDAGSAGVNGTNGQDLTAVAVPESCAVCHNGAGTAHQAVYNDYVDTRFAVTIDSVTSVPTGTTFTSTMLFTITKDGLPYVDAGLAGLNQKTYRAELYDSASRTFGGPTATGVFTYGSPTHLGNGQYSVTKTGATFAPESSNALVYMYIASGVLATEGMTLYADVTNEGLSYGDADTYVSTANVSGCEKCHGAPYRKHGYRMAAVNGLADMAACKVCHVDAQAGGHEAWQLLVDDPAAYAAQDGETTPAQDAMYAYKRTVMNDVHMSHAMEFAYPQSMANCATCHEGKLTSILTDANFTITTCRSCHPVTGTGGTDPKRAPALRDLMLAKFAHGTVINSLYADASPQPVCNNAGCHDAASSARFNQLHTGYNSMIYADAAGTRYSDVVTVSIDSATVTNNVLTIGFSAAESPDITGVAAEGIVPTVLVGLYGYDTKDFLVGSHGRTIDSSRDLEYVVGTTHPRFVTLSAPTGTTGTTGSWQVTANLSHWAAQIADGTIKRAEIAIMPQLKDAAGVTLALNAPSRTFDLGANAFDDTYFSPIVKIANGCNTCHDALATTFHSANRGGNITVCRLCHTTTSGGSHLEMQSRSIDSYVHAIHSFAPFDIGDIDFTDPVEELHYEHHIESTYPNFTIKNCESCHNAGTYNVPDQSKSMPGVHSAADTVTTKDRNIGAVPSYVTGPASRACGGCHRTELINEDNAGGLAALNQHVATNGYMLEETGGVLDAAIEAIMSLFE
jgi:OmcA/MtrC family decaheme c-type cytochrome